MHSAARQKMLLSLFVIVTTFVANARGAWATAPASAAPGTLVKDQICTPLKPYRELDDFGRWYFPENLWEEARAQTDYECHHVSYVSDGIAVSGYIIQPKVTNSRTWPAILYCRGGTGDFGVIGDLELVTLYEFAKAGYVVLATDYRRTGDKGKRDEWGGADVNDVLNLVPMAKELGYVDMERLFILGASRGGMMTYLALRREIAVKAAAVISGISDLDAFAKYRPEFVDGDGTYDGWAKVWPDFEHRKEEYFRGRSAVAWADKINTPLLILASRIDKKVPVNQAFAISEKLQQYNKEYEIVIYANDGHSLPMNRTDVHQHIVRWFQSHDPMVPRAK